MKKADIFIQSKAESWRDLIFQKNFPSGSVGKESTHNAQDTGDSKWFLSLGRSAGGRNGDPLQCSCLENPMDRGAWCSTVQRVTKSWMTERLSTHNNSKIVGYLNAEY